MNIAGLSTSCPELVADPSALLLHAANAPAGGNGISIPVREAGDFHAWFVSAKEPLKPLPGGGPSAIPQEEEQEPESDSSLSEMNASKKKRRSRWEALVALLPTGTGAQRRSVEAKGELSISICRESPRDGKPADAKELSGEFFEGGSSPAEGTVRAPEKAAPKSGNGPVDRIATERQITGRDIPELLPFQVPKDTPDGENCELFPAEGASADLPPAGRNPEAAPSPVTVSATAADSAGKQPIASVPKEISGSSAARIQPPAMAPISEESPAQGSPLQKLPSKGKLVATSPEIAHGASSRADGEMAFAARLSPLSSARSGRSPSFRTPSEQVVHSMASTSPEKPSSVDLPRTVTVSPAGHSAGHKKSTGTGEAPNRGRSPAESRVSKESTEIESGKPQTERLPIRRTTELKSRPSRMMSPHSLLPGGEERNANGSGRPGGGKAHGKTEMALPQAAEWLGQTGLSLRRNSVRELNLRVATPDDSAVDLRVVERGGHLHVAVRTPSAELASSLRHDLGDLVNRMECQGLHSETWTPGDGRPPAAVQYREIRTGTGDSPGGEYSAGGGHSSGDPDTHRRDSEDHRPEWLDELEETAPENRGAGMEKWQWLQLLRT